MLSTYCGEVRDLYDPYCARILQVADAVASPIMNRILKPEIAVRAKVFQYAKVNKFTGTLVRI